MTDGLRIAHLRIDPQWAILRWAILRVIFDIVRVQKGWAQYGGEFIILPGKIVKSHAWMILI